MKFPSEVRLGASALKWVLFALAAALAAWFFVLRPQWAQQDTADARGAAAVAEAGEGSARDTITIYRDRETTIRDINRTTEESSRDILNAPGADDLIDPDLHRRGIDALCLRDGRENEPACQHVLQ